MIFLIIFREDAKGGVLENNNVYLFLHKIIRIFNLFKVEVSTHVWKYYRCTWRKGGTCGK